MSSTLVTCVYCSCIMTQILMRDAYHANKFFGLSDKISQVVFVIILATGFWNT